MSRMTKKETEPEIKLLIQENSKLQELIVYTDGSVMVGLHCQSWCDIHP